MKALTLMGWIVTGLMATLMLLAIVGTGVSDGLDPRNVQDYVTFVTPGMIVMTALFSSTFSSASYYADRDCGIFKVFLSSPHPPRVIGVYRRDDLPRERLPRHDAGQPARVRDDHCAHLGPRERLARVPCARRDVERRRRGHHRVPDALAHG